MRVWQVRELGEPGDVLRLAEAPDPTAGPGEVVIAVDAVGLNFPDLLQIRGGYQLKPDLPFVPGQEVAGRVVAVGDGVSSHAIGDRVLWMGTGGLAERCAAPAEQAFHVPVSMPAEKAAALLMNYGTARFALTDRAHLAPGEVLLVHAGAGGVGSAAVQLGRSLGALVIATAGGPAKKRVLEDLGVDVPIDYLNEDFAAVVDAVTDGRGADVVYDPVGGDTFDRSRRCIAWDGRLLVIGFTSGRIPDVPANHVLLKNYAVVGVHWGGFLGRDPTALRRAYDELVGAWDAGTIDPLVGEVFPFEAAPLALERLANRAAVGKMVVTP